MWMEEYSLTTSYLFIFFKIHRIIKSIKRDGRDNNAEGRESERTGKQPT